LTTDVRIFAAALDEVEKVVAVEQIGGDVLLRVGAVFLHRGV
jgi:hypothetical protein